MNVPIVVFSIYFILCVKELKVHSLKNEFINKCYIGLGGIVFNCSDEFYPINFFRSSFYCSGKWYDEYDRKNSIRSISIENCDMTTIQYDIFGNYGPSTLDISSIGLKVLPSEFFKGANNLKRIFASKNRFTEISQSYFTHTNSLLEMDLSHNRIDRVDEKAFSDTNRLQILNISHNRISIIHPKTFHAPSLEILDISLNNILTIVKGTFSHLRFLEVLSIAHNNLTNIESGALVSQKHIENIHLNDNRLSELD